MKELSFQAILRPQMQAVESLDPLVTCLGLHSEGMQPGWIHNLDEDVPPDLFVCILSFLFSKGNL